MERVADGPYPANGAINSCHCSLPMAGASFSARCGQLSHKDASFLQGDCSRAVGRLCIRASVLVAPTEIVTTETLDKLATALNVDASLLIESDPPLPKVIEIDQAEK